MCIRDRNILHKAHPGGCARFNPSGIQIVDFRHAGTAPQCDHPVKSAVKGAGNPFPAGKFRPVPFCHIIDNRALRQKVACGKQACRADNHRRRLSYLPQYFRQCLPVRQTNQYDECQHKQPFPVFFQGFQSLSSFRLMVHPCMGALRPLLFRFSFRLFLFFFLLLFHFR